MFGSSSTAQDCIVTRFALRACSSEFFSLRTCISTFLQCHGTQIRKLSPEEFTPHYQLRPVVLPCSVFHALNTHRFLSARSLFRTAACSYTAISLTIVAHRGMPLSTIPRGTQGSVYARHFILGNQLFQDDPKESFTILKLRHSHLLTERRFHSSGESIHTRRYIPKTRRDSRVSTDERSTPPSSYKHTLSITHRAAANTADSNSSVGSQPPSRIILHTPQYTPYNIPHPHTSHTTNQPLNTPTACLPPPPPPPNPVTAATTLLHPNRYVYHTYVSERFSLSTHCQHRPAQSSVAGETHNGTASTSAVREGALVSWEKMRGISYGTSLRG